MFRRKGSQEGAPLWKRLNGYYLGALALSVPAAALMFAGVSAQQKAEPAETAPEETVSQEVPNQPGYWVYLDEEGNRIPRPKGAPTPEAPEVKGAPVVKELPDGSVGIRNPTVAYTYATRGPGGVVQVSCDVKARDADPVESDATGSHVCVHHDEHAETGKE